MPLGRHLDGYRIGFDLGASDRKASAVVDGEAIFSEEVVWDPRRRAIRTITSRAFIDSFSRAAANMPRLDAVGGSAAGVYINNRARVASLFRGVPPRRCSKKNRGLFLRIRTSWACR